MLFIRTHGAATYHAYNRIVEIKDADGNDLSEVVLSLSKDEVTELLIATSELDDGSKDHGFMRDPSGKTFVVYLDALAEPPPLEKGTDWWVGPAILVALIFMVVGAYTLANALVQLLF